MSRESFIAILGFLVFITPFLGVPRSYSDKFLMLIGIVLMFVGYGLRRAAFLRSIEQENGERRADAFVESVPDIKTQGELPSE